MKPPGHWLGVRRDGIRWRLRVSGHSLPFPRLLVSSTWRGVPFQIVQPWANAGLIWVIGKERSMGAFYDGADDHPEGALAWATWGAKKAIDKAFAAWPEVQA